jgi:hypothetical protein
MKASKKIVKNCLICKEEFFTYKIKQTCCTYSCARKNTWKNSEYRKTKINELKKWTDEMKKRQSDIQKEHQNKPDVKIQRSKIQKIAQNKPGVNEKRSDKAKTLWADLDYAERVLSSGLRYKEYKMPSGKIVKLQGYENKVLSELLESYQEDDIVIGVKNINKEIGTITYTLNNKICKYFPDFFIKSLNTVIEVKSQWTYDKQKEKNELKKNACLIKGLNFKFIIK